MNNTDLLNQKTIRNKTKKKKQFVIKQKRNVNHEGKLVINKYHVNKSFKL